MLSSGSDHTTHPLGICFVVRALPVHRLGGLEHHVMDLAVALARRGNTVHLVTTVGGKSQQADGVTVHEVPGSKPGDYSITFFRNVSRVTQQVCRENSVDVVCPIDMAAIFMDPAHFTVPLVPVIHGTMTSEVPLDWRYWSHLGGMDKLRYTWRYKLRFALLPAFRRMIRRAETVIVDSEFTRRELYLDAGRRGDILTRGRSATQTAERIRVVPLGIDFARYPNEGLNLPRNDSRFIISMLGRLQKMKGIQVALRAAAALRMRGVDFLLRIGGTGDYAIEARRLVDEYGLENFVELAGRISPEDVDKFFRSSDVFLFPDLTQPAFGLVAVEAMQYGVPVVAARSGAIPEVVVDSCGWLYSPWNVDELAGLLMQLAQSRDEVEKKAAAALQRSKEFTAGRMAADTEAVLLKAAGKR